MRSPEHRGALVRRSLKNVISAPEAALTVSAGELDFTLRLARRARLLGRLASRLEGLGLIGELPPQAQEQLRSSLAVVAARHRVARWELDRVARALRACPDVPVVALKGCAYLLAGLPNAAGRLFADVDLLVAEEHLEQVERVLQANGWRGKRLSAYDEHYYRAWTHELPPMMHGEREVEVDLHHNILPRTARLKPSGALLLRDAQPMNGERFLRLSDADLVLHAMTHLMFDSDMADALRELVDIDELIRHFGAHDPQFWGRLMARAAELDLRRPAFYALRYARNLLGTPVPDQVLQASSLSAPPRSVLWAMDHLIPSALHPQHPDSSSAFVGVARFVLYVRSLWIRMPQWLLVRHLTYKFYVRRLGSSARRARALR